MPVPPPPDDFSPSASTRTPPPKKMGYPRSASVTAAVEYFEERKRSNSSNTPPTARPSLSQHAQGSPRGSPFNSPRHSLSSEAGPSRQSSPRLRVTPRGSVSQRGRSVTTPMERVGSEDSRSGRSDSSASSTRRPSIAPIGLGMSGMRISANGRRSSGESTGGTSASGRRSSDTHSHKSLRIRQPRPSLPATTALPPPVRPPPPSLMRRQSIQPKERMTSASSTTTVIDLNTPRIDSSSQMQSSPNGPSYRSASSTRSPASSPRSTPSRIASGSRIPAPSKSTPGRGGVPPRPSRTITPPTDTSTPAVYLSEATPERRIVPRRNPSGTSPTDPHSGHSPTSAHGGRGSRGMPYRISSQSSLQSIPSLDSVSGRESQSSSPRKARDSGDKQLPALPLSSSSSSERFHPLSPPRIPTRISSQPSSQPSSPTSASYGHSQPLISPRLSSISGFSPRGTTSIGLPNVASDHVVLGDVVAVDRRLPKDAKYRRSPGLTIDPPPFNSTSSTQTKPNPPVPAKSPLRRLSKGGSIAGASRAHSRTVSRDSVASSTLSEDYGFTVQSFPPTDEMSPTTRDNRRLPVERKENHDVELTPQTSHPHLHDEYRRRSTIVTGSSVFYQNSASSTVPWDGTLREQQEGPNGETRVRRRSSRMDDLWGRSSRTGSASQVEKTPSLQTNMPLRLSVPGIDFSQAQTESPQSSTDNGSATSIASRDAMLGHSAGSSTPINEVPPRPHRSPSVPILNGAPAPKAARLLGIDSNGAQGRIPAPLLPSALTRSPTAPTLGSNDSTPRTASFAVSKRTHLIREIASTERAYATDLALICDAYLSRYLRANPNGPSPSLRRSGSTSSQSRRMSGTDWSAGLPTPIQVSPFPRSPHEGPYGYFSPSSSDVAAMASVSSLRFSPAESSRSSLVTGMTSLTSASALSMAPPVGKPLSPSDIRAIFLNIDSLARGAEEMAKAFEGAVGGEEPGPGSVVREGEGGTDRLGEVFVALLPRLQETYHYYCSRQHSASSRLQELLSDPPTSAHLNDCWSQIKDRTHAWNLDSMLIKPVQRITKYPLLFEDLLACTTPVHPDYFNIRAAAELSRSVAVEIDEAKRRKDVVASALSLRKPKTPKSTLPSPAKDTKKGLNIFRKEKLPASLPSSASSIALASDVPPPEISKTSFAILRDLIARVEEADQVVKRVGKEALIWTSASKDVLIVERGMLDTWRKVVQLDTSDPAPERMTALRKVLDGLITDVWSDLNEEVKERIMPIFSKLLDSTSNPRRVIAKHDSKQSDYARYFASVRARKAPERAVLMSAREFHALHSQLSEELPIFMEGYMRILDLALVGFSAAQARYFDAVRQRLDEFAKRWVARPRQSPRTVISPGAEDVDLSTGRGIVRAWQQAWSPYAEAMDNFACTRPAKALASRIASFNNRPGSRPASRPTSRVSSPGPMVSPSANRPSLHHSASFTSQVSSTGSTASRSRSHSLLGPAPAIPLPSPVKESRFNVFRSNSNSASLGSTRNTPTMRSQPTPSPRAARPASLHLPNGSAAEQRYSFGLPKIDQGFEGLGKIGLSPVGRVGNSLPAPRVSSPGAMRSVSEGIQHVPEEEEEEDSPSIRQEEKLSADRVPTRSSTEQRMSYSGASIRTISSSSMNAGLGLGDVESAPASRRPSATTISSVSRVPSSSVPTTMSTSTSSSTINSMTSSSTTAPPPSSYQMSAVRSKDALERTTRPAPTTPNAKAGMTRSTSTPVVSTAYYSGGGRSATRVGTAYQIDASEGWRDEPVLYQCECVAAFDPLQVGNERYRGLRFLPMMPGDLFDIFHEVGRIDELPKFPYPEIGVENDGVLVGRAEQGDIGLLICSFLEPLYE